MSNGIAPYLPIQADQSSANLLRKLEQGFVDLGFWLCVTFGCRDDSGLEQPQEKKEIPMKRSISACDHEIFLMPADDGDLDYIVVPGCPNARHDSKTVTVNGKGFPIEMHLLPLYPGGEPEMRPAVTIDHAVFVLEGPFGCGRCGMPHADGVDEATC